MKKKVFAGLMSVMIVLSLCGCGEEPLPYNMKQITGVTFNEEFLLSHSTYGVMHCRYYTDIDGNKKYEYWIDEESPKYRSVIIENEDDFNEAFSYYNTDGIPDFKTRMIAILFFTGRNRRDYEVEKAKISDDILYLNIIGREPYSCSMGIGGLPPSDLEWQIVEMDKYYITMVDKWQ